ncbi:ABC transporter substrate-binding protein [Rhodococcus phenolicus]|uniref:ABC transporter substrate-binding protein n=1 Tax=Rhodococcus phenolicus TaxID=263849 RepID=UPI000A98047A|nr:ABC transporter substrate-binding protein [Rhodococcus phenolicus]
MKRHHPFRVGQRRVVVAVAAIALLAAGCSGRSGTESDSAGGSGSDSSSEVSADFGDLTDICQDGDASTATTQGVTAEQIEVGVFTDMGFTKNSEFVDAANVFTSWCNDNGGINGRTLVANTRDAKLMEPRQRMIEACREDFALVGGGAGLDALGVKERLGCLLPSFPAQAVQERSAGADLEISASPSKVPGYDNYTGFRTWTVNEAYPDSKQAVGLINGDSAITKAVQQMTLETLDAIGAKVVYNELYPTMGVSDWTPYAQAIKNNGVKGLIFMGSFDQLAKLEEVLTNMDYKLDWIDPNNNAYNAQFIELLGRSADFQNNLVDLSGVAPLESDEPAVEQLKELYAKYAPDAQITLPAMRAWSSWLLFAKSAAACGDDLTRTCLYETARGETAWTGGGLHAASDLQNPIPPQPCFNVEKATSEGWTTADFNPDSGLYRCDIPARKFTADFGAPMTLADVGKTMDDVQ